MKKRVLTMVAAAAVCATQTAMAQFFTNDLTDAAGVAMDFTENMSSHSNSVWSYTNDYAVGEDGTTNTVLQGGAVQDWATVDDDTARSYLTTVYSNYLDHSWTAHVAIEAPSGNPYIFFGLGTGKPLESYYNEPRDGENVFVVFNSGNSNSKVSIRNNHGATLLNTGLWRGDPGYDFWLTYNHINQTIQLDLDDWNGGRFSDIDISTPQISIAGELTDTNMAHIFFGANAKVTWGDFYVEEIDAEVPPATPAGFFSVVSNMQVTLHWDVAGGADAYNLMRSTDSGSNYVSIATLTTNIYIDTNLETNETYYYVVNATNQFGESGTADEVTGVGFPYDILGPVSSYGYGPLEKDNLFDNDLDTFYDTVSAGSWAGFDFGEGNEQRILQIDYVLRNWSLSVSRAPGAFFQGANSTNFSGAEILHVVSTNVMAWPAVNTAIISNPKAFRYVRLHESGTNPLYAFGELDFITGEPLGAEFTAIEPVGSEVDITFTTLEDYKYTMESSADLLMATNWNEVPPFTNMVATGTTITVSLPVASLTESAELLRVASYPPDPPPSYLDEDFEGDSATNWMVTTVAGTEWELGTPNVNNSFYVLTNANSGVNCYATDTNATYTFDTDTVLSSPSFVIGTETVVVEWVEGYDIQDDIATMSVIDESAGTTNLVHTTAPGTGSSNVWLPRLVTVPLTPTGQTIRIEFRFEAVDLGSGHDGGFAGWFIDDVLVRDQ